MSRPARRSPSVDLPAGPLAKAKVPSPRTGQSTPEKPWAERGTRKPSGQNSAPRTAGGSEDLKTSSLASSILPTAVVARPDAARKLKDSPPASRTAARAAVRASSKSFISSGQTAAASFKGNGGEGEGKPAVKSTLAIGKVPSETIVGLPTIVSDGSLALSHADEASLPMWEILQAQSTKEHRDAEQIEGEPSDLFTPERRARTPQEGLIQKSQHDDDSGSDDSEHFDLTHLETPAASPMVSATPDIIKDMDASSQHQVEPQISTISPFQQDATWIWADTDGIEAPTPPPRARSRSSTPPSDHDVYFEIRRKRQREKKRTAKGEPPPDQTWYCHPPAVLERDMSGQEKGKISAHAHQTVERKLLLTSKSSLEESQGRSQNAAELISASKEGDQCMAGGQHVEEDRQLPATEDTEKSTHFEVHPKTVHANDSPVAHDPNEKFRTLMPRPPQRPVKAQLMDVLEERFEQQPKVNVEEIAADVFQRAASVEDELRVREELAHQACANQDVAALCFALSFTKSCIKAVGDQTNHSGSDRHVRRGSQRWQEAQLSPLHEAAAVGSEEMMHLLLERGKFTVDSRTTSGNTALHICIWEGHLKAAEFLMVRGASTTIENRNGQRAFDLLSAGILEPFSVDDLPLLMNAASAVAVFKAENILGVRAHESAKLKRDRFRDLASLAKSDPSHEEVEHIGLQSSGRSKFFNLVCAAYDVLLHHRDIKYTASRASFRTSDEWAEVFFVLERKGLGDLVEWFLRNEVDGQRFLELSIEEMCALGLDADRAVSIWRVLHGVQSVETLEEWLTEHGELPLYEELCANGITSVQHLLDANLKEIIRKVGPRRRLELLVQQQRAASSKPASTEFDHHAQSTEFHARYIPADAGFELREKPNPLDHDANKQSDDAMPAQIVEEVMIQQQLNGELRDAMIDMADELAANARREHHTHLEVRVRIQKLKLRVKDLRMRAEDAEDRASCASQAHEAALLQLEQQARAHARVIADKDAQILAVQAELNEAKIEALTNDSFSSWPCSQVFAPASTLHTENHLDGSSHRDFSSCQQLSDSEDSFALSASNQNSVEDLAFAMAHSCVRKYHVRKVPRADNSHSLTNNKSNYSLGMSSIADRENGHTNQFKHSLEDIDEKQAQTRKEALRTLRLINKELQMQALDLKTSLAEAKRDKAMDNVTISSLQQRASFLSKQLEQQKEERRKQERESCMQREQLEKLLNSVTRLVGNAEFVDAMCQEVYQVKLINSQLLKTARGERTAQGGDSRRVDSHKRETRRYHPNEAPAATFFCKRDYSRLRSCCLESRVGSAYDADIWGEVEDLLHENEALKKHLEDRGQTASYRAERQREQDKNAVEHAMLKMVQQLEQDVKSSKEEFVLARTRMLDTSKKLLRREREQASKTLRSMSIAHAQFERQAQRERERQRTEQQGDKDLEAALKHATQVIENLEADVISLRQAQRVQRVSDSEDDKKSNMLETSVADFETQPAILKDVCASMVSASSTKEAQCVHRVSDLDHEDGLEAQFALLEVERRIQ